MKLVLISEKVGLSFMVILKIQLPFYFQKQFCGLAIKFKLHMEECPPGYVLVPDPKFNLNLSCCVCSIGTNKSYRGIHSCNYENFTSSLRHGYWIGYVGGETESHLFYGYCPNRYCFHKYCFHYLTNRASRRHWTG